MSEIPPKSKYKQNTANRKKSRTTHTRTYIDNDVEIPPAFASLNERRRRNPRGYIENRRTNPRRRRIKNVPRVRCRRDDYLVAACIKEVPCPRARALSPFYLKAESRGPLTQLWVAAVVGVKRNAFQWRFGLDGDWVGDVREKGGREGVDRFWDLKFLRFSSDLVILCRFFESS